MATANPERWDPGNEHNQCWGADIVAAATIAPTHGYHRVTGTTQIDTITPPWNTFAGEITLLAAAAFTMTGAAGNIRGSAVTAVANQCIKLVYNPSQGFWYPVKY